MLVGPYFFIILIDIMTNFFYNIAISFVTFISTREAYMIYPFVLFCVKYGYTIHTFI